MSRFFIGTSGWSYPHWQEIFYPDDLNRAKWLEYYAQFFNAVELNVTFYRLVQKKTFENWFKRTPGYFHFVAKGSRFITHVKKLKAVGEPLGLFLDNVIRLKAKLAGILWQLPPGFKKDAQRLKAFLTLLKKTPIRQIFEFKNESWFDREVFSLLKKFNACLCIAHSGRFPCVREVTADFLYLRFHGGAELYGSDYADDELKQWSDFLAGFKRKDVFVFFNNDARGYAVKNAIRFRQLLEKKQGAVR